jgi:hypothetical protein
MLISTGIILVGEYSHCCRIDGMTLKPFPIGQFTLFFGSPALKKKGARGLAWFFGQWFYTVALITLLAGMAIPQYLR